MRYIRPQRQYRNIKTGQTSPLLHEVIGNSVTLDRNFSCGVRRGTWTTSPFKEIEIVNPMELVPSTIDVIENAPNEQLTIDEAVPLLFDAICESIKETWQLNKTHVVFHSSGWDSRIISSAVKRIKFYDVFFLANRWEAKEAIEILTRQGWNELSVISYDEGDADNHFADSLNFDTFWEENNPPVPLPGNLWWYLPKHAQSNYEQYLQGYAGLFANETWKWFNVGGYQMWLRKYITQYYYTTIAMHPQKIPVMEYPLSDINVLAIVNRVRGTSGDKLRQAVANYACPEAADVPHLTLDDRGHRISNKLIKQCEKSYHKSWYGKTIKPNWICPPTSEFSNNWADYGLASLCEELRRRGVKIK